MASEEILLQFFLSSDGHAYLSLHYLQELEVREQTEIE